MPTLGTGLSAAVLVGAGIGAAALISQALGKDDEDAGAAGAGATARALSYSGPADFQTPEYAAQQGLRVVKAETLYYNGHYGWYTGGAADPAAGSGVGVKIAVADTGINAREAATGGFIAIDASASYDYVNDRAGSAADDAGHGTHVAGIIAAPRNGEGMHGLAYSATIVNFKVGDADARITASDAQRADMIRRAADAGAMIINNSWGSGSAITALSAEQVQAAMPLLIEAARAYV
ncbi:MAG: S8 family serine peptidase, partial [Burkholderiales bacterium]